MSSFFYNKQKGKGKVIVMKNKKYVDVERERRMLEKIKKGTIDSYEEVKLYLEAIDYKKMLNSSLSALSVNERLTGSHEVGDGTGSYTDGVHINMGFNETYLKLTPKEFMSNEMSVRLHEVFHVHYTKFDIYAETINQIKDDLFDTIKDNVKEMSKLKEILYKTETTEFARSLANIIEDGRIEHLGSYDNRVFRMVRNVSRIEEWEKYDLEKLGIDLNGDNALTHRFTLLRNTLLTFSTMRLYPKNFEKVVPKGDVLWTLLKEVEGHITSATTTNRMRKWQKETLNVYNLLKNYLVEFFISHVENSTDEELEEQLENQMKQYQDNDFRNTPGELDESSDEDDESKGDNSSNDNESEEDNSSNNNESEDNSSSDDKSSGEGYSLQGDKKTDKDLPSSNEPSDDEDSSENGSSNGDKLSDEEDSSESDKSSESNSSNGEESSDEEDDSQSNNSSGSNSSNDEESSNSNDEFERTVKELERQNKERKNDIEKDIEQGKNEFEDLINRAIESFSRKLKNYEKTNEIPTKNFENAQKDYVVNGGYGELRFYGPSPHEFEKDFKISQEVLKESKKLEEYFEEVFEKREEKERRNLRKGRLNVRQLTRLKAGRKDVFKKTKRSSPKKTAGYLLIDGSGSMHGESHEEAMTSGTIIELALRNLIPLKIAQFKSPNHDGIFVAKDFEDKIKTDSFCQALKDTFLAPNGGNTDGLSIRIAIEDLLQRNENEKVLVVISDGMPTGYRTHEQAVNHVRKTVEYGKSHGIKILSLFIGDEYSIKRHYTDFKYMYGDSVVFSKPENLSKEIQKTFKNFIR